MLLILMYHQVANPADTSSLKAFQQHLVYLVENFRIVVPGTLIPKDELSICLTFDDAYYDFYHYVYPLLRAYHIKAVLGIPTHFIQESGQAKSQIRLSVPYPQGLNFSTQNQQPLCCWDELLDMTQSGYVIPASHSHNHCNFQQKNVSLDNEILGSKQLLEQKLQTKVNSFIYPYGNISRKAHAYVKQHYQYGIRIGSAINYHWDHRNKLYYRVDADPFWKNNQLFSVPLIKRLKRKYWINRLRGK